MTEAEHRAAIHAAQTKLEDARRDFVTTIRSWLADEDIDKYTFGNLRWYLEVAFGPSDTALDAANGIMDEEIHRRHAANTLTSEALYREGYRLKKVSP